MIKNTYVVDRTEKIAGAGLIKYESIKYSNGETRMYTTLGAIASKITPDVINAVSLNAENITKQLALYAKNGMAEQSDLIGALMGEVAQNGLFFIKALAEKMDKTIPLEAIIKMMRYCKSEMVGGTMIIDTTIAEIIGSLPLNQKKAYKIYTGEPIKSLDEIAKINYSNKDKENIGYLLYFMTRATGRRIENRDNLMDCLRMLGVEYMLEDFKGQYLNDARNKTAQVRSVCSVFEKFEPDKIQIDPGYFTTVAEKLKMYVPEGCENESKAIGLGGKTISALLDKNLAEVVNCTGESIGLLIDAKKKNKDDIKDECRKVLVKEHGVEGNFIDERIMPEAEEMNKYYD